MSVTTLVDSIINARSVARPDRALLVGVSGIDASGKGYISSLVADGLEDKGSRVALINADAWLNLPSVRFSDSYPGEHFYSRALRLDEMFSRLILPLQRDRAITSTADLAEETSAEFRRHTYRFTEIDVILLEGIFIFKHRFAGLFDLRIWIDCDFDVALERAIRRSQEGLPPDATAEAYRTIYFPAQQLHLALDLPREAADILVPNY